MFVNLLTNFNLYSTHKGFTVASSTFGTHWGLLGICEPPEIEREFCSLASNPLTTRSHPLVTSKAVTGFVYNVDHEIIGYVATRASFGLKWSKTFPGFLKMVHDSEKKIGVIGK